MPPYRLRAWKCRSCHQLTLRGRDEPDPTNCDHCQGEIGPFLLKKGHRP